VTSRLYRSTRLLATRAALVLRRLGIDGVGTPTTAALISLYLPGWFCSTGTRGRHASPASRPAATTTRSTGCCGLCLARYER
jgi:hypothetical protein